MKLLVSTSYYRPYTSGLSIYAARLAEGLAKRNHQVSVLCLKHTQLSSQETIDDVQIIRCAPQFFIGKGGVAISWLWQACLQVKRHQVVIVNLPQFEGWVVAVMAKLMGKRLIAIYTCDVYLPVSALNGLIQATLDWANRLSLLLADKVVTYTVDYAEHSRLLSKFLSKTSYNLPPIPAPKAKKADVLNLQKQLSKRRFYVGIAARVAAEKGFEYLFATLPQLETLNIQIVVAGDPHPLGEADYVTSLKEQIAQYQSRITFLGNLSFSQMGAFYHLIDVLVVPSINSTEAFGMVQIEAMLMGKPVIATNLPGVRIPVQTTGAGLIIPKKDTKALAQAIATVLLHPNHYRPNVDQIHQFFSETSFFANWQEVLRSPLD